MTPDPPAAPAPPAARDLLRSIASLAFVAVRALDEGDRDAAEEAARMVKERAAKL